MIWSRITCLLRTRLISRSLLGINNRSYNGTQYSIIKSSFNRTFVQAIDTNLRCKREWRKKDMKCNRSSFFFRLTVYGSCLWPHINRRRRSLASWNRTRPVVADCRHWIPSAACSACEMKRGCILAASMQNCYSPITMFAAVASGMDRQ